MAALRAYEAAVVGGVTSADQGSCYMSMANMAQQMLETVVKPEEQLRDELMNIGLKTTAAAIPVLPQLTAGNHTVDLQPEPKSQEPLLVEDEDYSDPTDPQEH